MDKYNPIHVSDTEKLKCDTTKRDEGRIIHHEFTDKPNNDIMEAYLKAMTLIKTHIQYSLGNIKYSDGSIPFIGSTAWMVKNNHMDFVNDRLWKVVLCQDLVSNGDITSTDKIAGSFHIVRYNDYDRLNKTTLNSLVNGNINALYIIPEMSLGPTRLKYHDQWYRNVSRLHDMHSDCIVVACGDFSMDRPSRLTDKGYTKHLTLLYVSNDYTYPMDDETDE